MYNQDPFFSANQLNQINVLHPVEVWLELQLKLKPAQEHLYILKSNFKWSSTTAKINVAPISNHFRDGVSTTVKHNGANSNRFITDGLALSFIKIIYFVY